MAPPATHLRQGLSSPARDAAAFYEALADLLRVYQFRDRDQICCFDVSVTQCYAMETLVRRGPLRLNRLASELYLDKSTASRVISALVRKGYVARSADPSDARAVVLRVTTAGEALYRRVRRQLIRQQSRLLADIPAESRRAAIRLLRRLARTTAARLAGRASVGTDGCACSTGSEAD